MYLKRIDNCIAVIFIYCDLVKKLIKNNSYTPFYDIMYIELNYEENALLSSDH